MNKLIIALGVAALTSTAAFADGSTALDANFLPQETAAFTTAAPMAQNNEQSNLQRGVSPRASGPSFDGTIDYTATASIGDDASVSGNGYVQLWTQPRLGDGVRAY
ncbi:hypothetical protein [Pseudohoeflea coraliihabitans]|uniref:Uncharacterized protein n=1 Tax=Pseudohoeflea coraliihabitans TaxID=2860393 RepID=A0ABS6WLL7_9HYPH|nr:hypothetical protein [Pseudohoeflea sp. DP4N28-3]MBW3096859.1 hypothetical protein [Pseudohoeflea sp. DP4N28-3]